MCPIRRNFILLHVACPKYLGQIRLVVVVCGLVAYGRLLPQGHGSLERLFEDEFGRERSEYWDSDLNESTSLW